MAHERASFEVVPSRASEGAPRGSALLDGPSLRRPLKVLARLRSERPLTPVSPELGPTPRQRQDRRVMVQIGSSKTAADTAAPRRNPATTATRIDAARANAIASRSYLTQTQAASPVQNARPGRAVEAGRQSRFVDACDCAPETAPHNTTQTRRTASPSAPAHHAATRVHGNIAPQQNSDGEREVARRPRKQAGQSRRAVAVVNEVGPSDASLQLRGSVGVPGPAPHPLRRRCGQDSKLGDGQAFSQSLNQERRCRDGTSQLSGSPH